MGLKQVYLTWMSVFPQWNSLINAQEPRWRGTLFCSRYLGSFGVGLCFAKACAHCFRSQGETCVPEWRKMLFHLPRSFQELLPLARQRIIDGFSSKARDIFQRESDFFDKVSSISGVIFPLPNEERRAGIRR
ncbi:hypothetical protein CASFOL_028880 [Castilleja foliolosa]|uniref:Uncharacterized protein n=1 Tax=Castilleja foliolosa TaxID=1961234 RepID=A0ABD3CDA7_9LAMI